MNILQDIYSLSDAESALAKHGVATDTVYQDVIDQGYRFGVHHENKGIHVYFNQGRSNVAYYTPALNTLAIFDQPRRDDMCGEKHFIRRPASFAAGAHAH
jgi:hypothetical protein